MKAQPGFLLNIMVGLAAVRVQGLPLVLQETLSSTLPDSVVILPWEKAG